MYLEGWLHLISINFCYFIMFPYFGLKTYWVFFFSFVLIFSFNSFFKIVILLCADRMLILLLWSLFRVLLSLDGSPRLQRSGACAACLCTAIVLARRSLEHGSCLPLHCTNAHVPSSQWISFHVPPFSHWGPGTLLLPSTCSMLFHSSCLPATITKTQM